MERGGVLARRGVGVGWDEGGLEMSGRQQREIV